MFDGIARLPMREPARPQPDALDVRRLLPLLKSQAAGSAVETLATAVAENTIAMRRWLRRNWPEGDWRDPAHPWRAHALAETSPPARLADTQAALADALARYRATTGRRDGLLLARRTIEDAYGGEIADAAVAPLLAASAVEREIAALLAPATSPAPTPAQRRAGAAALAEWLLSSPELDGLRDALDSLQAASGDCREGVAGVALQAAVERLRGVLGALLGHRAIDAGRLQVLLDWWSEATGAPRVSVTGENDNGW